MYPHAYRWAKEDVPDLHLVCVGLKVKRWDVGLGLIVKIKRCLRPSVQI